MFYDRLFASILRRADKATNRGRRKDGGRRPAAYEAVVL
jgi:hypothetical protein